MRKLSLAAVAAIVGLSGAFLSGPATASPSPAAPLSPTPVSTPAPAQEVAVTAQPIDGSERVEANNTCPTGSVCGWSQPNRQGTRVVLRNPDPACQGFPGSPVPTVRSVSNQSGGRVQFHSGDCSSSYFTLPSGYYSDNTPFLVVAVGVYRT